MPFAYLTTFYSYKGGVGRTLAMANVGAVLAQRGEGRVLLVDCDLEAPGLHRIPSLTPPTPLDGGLLPWLAELDPDAPEDASRDALWLDALYAPRKDLALDVLPACHGDDAPRYYNRIDWPRWFAFKDRVTKTSALLQALRRMLVLLQSRGYAYVLIDSRTGFSDLGGLMLFQLPHMAVVVSNYNEQNLGGLKPVLKAMLRFTDPEQAPNHGEMRGYFPPPAGTPADAHQLGVLERWLVFSPVPGRLPELAPLREQRQERARALLGSDYAQNFYTEIPTYTAFQLQESLAVLDAPDGELAQSYRDIALKIEANRGERLRMLADAERATRRIGPVGLDSAQFGVATLRQGPSTTARGRSFEQKVAELLRLMGYEVQGETRVEGKKVDLIAKGGRGLRKEHYVVECKDQKAAISNSQVIELWSSVETEQQKVRHAGGIFVTSGDYSPDARAIGAAKGLLLYTLAELEREIFDPEPYAHAWQQAYEGKREAQSYVAQQVFITGGDQATRNRGAAPATTRPDQPLDVPDLAGPDSDVDTQGQTKAAERIDLIPYSLAWLGVGSSPQPLPNRFWLLLGNYGTGKSTFTRRLTFELLRRRRVGEAVPLPILINLKERAGAPNLDDLLQAFLREYRLDASLQQLRYGLEQGRAVLLLDSFDEMALAQYGRTLDQQLREFGRLVQEYPDARVLLTSRTHLFKSEGDLDRQVRSSDSLAQPGSALAGTARELGATVQTLAPFTPAQIGTFIRLHAPQRAEAIEHFIAQTHKLSELAPTAVLLEMIISGYDALRQRAATDEIRAAELYQVFVDEWLGARAHRHAELDTEQRKQWLEVLARLLWDTPGQRLHYQHLYEQIQSRRDLSAALDPARVDLELRTASFLTRNSAGDYGYSHRSFLEFFLARALLRALQATQGVAPEAAVLRLLPALPDTHMSPECLRFLRDLAELCCADARAVTAFWRHVATLLRQLLQAPRPPAQSANALRIARDCLPDPAEGIPEGAELAGADLSGETWALPLRGANLRGADLRRATFWAGEGDTWTFADLSGAVLAEAQIERADFSGVRLDSADVRGAHGEGARFVQSQCRGANFQLAQLMSAEFRGAELDGTDFSGTKLANARFRNASRSGWHWADAVFTGVPYTERPDHSLPCVTYPRTANVLTSRGSAAKMIQISDGLVMVGRSLGQIELWDVRSGHCTAVLAGHHGAITGLCTLPNGALASSSDGDGLKVWDHGHQSTGLSRPLRYGSIVSALCALPDGSLAAGSIDTTVHVCNLSDATSTILSGHDGRVSALCPLPEGNLASGSTDQTIRVWDFKHNKCTVLEGHNSPVTALCTLPNGILASGSADCTIRLWNIKNQSSIVLDGHFRGVTALCATSTHILVSGSACILHLWNPEEKSPFAVMFGHMNEITALLAFPNDTIISSSEDGTIRIWKIDDHSSIALDGQSKHARWVTSLCAFPNGKFASGFGDRAIRIWNLDDARSVVLEGHQQAVMAVCALSNDTLASASIDKTIRIWLLDQSTSVFLEGHTAPVTAICAISNNRLASGSNDQTIRIWNLDDHSCVILEEHTSAVTAVCTFPDGQLASGSADGTARAWNLEDRSSTILDKHDAPITALCAISNIMIATASTECTTVRIVNLHDQSVGILEGHSRHVTALCVLPNGALASGARDYTIRVWDPGTGRCTHEVPVATQIRALTTQGHLLIAGLLSGEILYFDIRPAALAASNTLRQVLSVRFHADEHILVYPDGAFWWPARDDGLLPELADHTWFRLLDRPLTDPDAAFPASAIAHERLSQPRSLKQILGPLPRKAGKRRQR